MLFFALLLLLAPDHAAELEAGDSAFFAMRYPEAIEHYLAGHSQFPESAEFCWRLARTYVCSGEILQGADRTRTMRDAERYARKAILNDSLSADAHVWLAGALGYLALDASVADQVTLTRELHHEAMLALTLRPDDDGALSILGSCYRALGNLSWIKRTLASLLYGSIPDGGYAEAESLLVRAESVAPTVMRHPYELGVLYLDMGRKAEAGDAFRRAVGLPVRVAIDKPRLEAARRFLYQLSSGE
jgi:tetratricopeptide (TPR) repeat protein